MADPETAGATLTGGSLESRKKISDERPTIMKVGGYEPGPKSMSDLKPPPKNLGAGSKPKDEPRG
ncbi:MAG: hypothetical protein ACRDKA_08315 [Actinomycetota bacterium]